MLLCLSHVAKRFDNGVAALSDADFSVTAGQFVTLLGPSGCGKSTLLRLIAGLSAPSDGTVTWLTGRPELGFVFQEPTLMPWADALANARLGLDLRRAPDADARAAQALARVGLAGFERALPRQLSGGMKMRVSIARALCSFSEAVQPKLLLLDEPFAALDEITRAALNDDLLTLAKEDGITVIFVTHSVSESCYLSDRVLVMTPRPGRIAADIPMTHERGPALRLSPQFLDSQKLVSAALLQAAAA